MDDFNPLEKVFIYTCHLLGWFWNTVSFYPWYFLSGNYERPRLGAIQGKSITNSPEGPYRNIHCMDHLKSGYDGVKTLDILFKNAVAKHGNKKCLGTRELLSEEDEVQPNGRIFKKVILGEYNWISYNEVNDHVQRISSGIKALGVKTKQYVIIFAETKAEWMLTAQACFLRNFPVVTIYATLGDDALVYGFNEAESTFVFTDAALLPKLQKLMTQLHFVQTVVYFGNAKKSLINELPEHVNVYSLQQVEDVGSKLKNIEVPIESPEPDDVAVVMYTSGSTGVPKGVIISHYNITSCLNALTSAIIPLSSSDRYIGYLPLAHIMELTCECTCMSLNVPVGYSSALTLSDKSSKIKKGTQGDVSVLKPTVMAAVPMIMDRMRKAVLDKVNSGPRVMKLVFQFAYDYKLKQTRQGYDTPILNKLIFSKIKSLLGGEVKFLLSGGAPLSPATEEFMNVCFCCTVGQGYGLTETCAGGTLSSYWDQSTGRVGRPVGSCQLKLVNWEEGGYTANDKPYPRGEIVIGGNNVSLGYLKQEEKTKEVFKFEDGVRWFYTGDIGEVQPDGVFKIIDRKKDLVKLAHGEYISLGKIETTLAHCKYIENCCAFGDSQEVYMILLVVPVHAQLQTLAGELGISGSFEEFCSNTKIIETVKKDVLNVAKTGNLHKSETPQKIKLCIEQWTPESDMVTAAFKLKRKQIQNYYQRDIEMLYLN